MEFEVGKFYHIYNRGNDGQKIFFNRENYMFFLRKVRRHLKPFTEILAYCLMPNHFHLLLYIPETLENSPGDWESPGESRVKALSLGASDTLSKKITDGIAVMLRSYTRAINKRYDRSGSLFQQATRAKNLDNNDKDYPFVCFHYINQNPVKSKLVKNFGDWEYSSYRDYAGYRKGTLCNKRLASELLDVPLNNTAFRKQSENVKIFDEF